MQAFHLATAGRARRRARRASAARARSSSPAAPTCAAAEGQCRAPDAAGRPGRICRCRSIEADGADLRHRRAGADERRRRRIRTCARGWPVICRGAAGQPPRRRCATWRRSAATCCSARAAAISATPVSPATSAQPGSGCPAIDGENRMLRDPRRQRPLHRHLSRRSRGRADRARRRGGARRAGRRARRADRAVLSPAGRYAAYRDGAAAGEMITAVLLPGRAPGRARAISSCATARASSWRSPRRRWRSRWTPARCGRRASQLAGSRPSRGACRGLSRGSPGRRSHPNCVPRPPRWRRTADRAWRQRL